MLVAMWIMGATYKAAVSKRQEFRGRAARFRDPAIEGSGQTTRHSHSMICAITSPKISSAAAQTKAETKFAIWKLQYGISKMPAASGTEARSVNPRRKTCWSAA